MKWWQDLKSIHAIDKFLILFHNCYNVTKVLQSFVTFFLANISIKNDFFCQCYNVTKSFQSFYNFI